MSCPRCGNHEIDTHITRINDVMYRCEKCNLVWSGKEARERWISPGFRPIFICDEKTRDWFWSLKDKPYKKPVALYWEELAIKAMEYRK